MEMAGKIRRMYFRDRMSLHEIAKRTDLSRNTIRKWVRAPQEAMPPKYRRGEVPSKLTVFHAALEQALKACAHAVNYGGNVLAHGSPVRATATEF